MLKKIFKECLVFGMILGVVSYQGNVGAALASGAVQEGTVDLEVPNDVSLTRANQKIVRESKDIALEQGTEAGEKLLQIGSEKQYKEAVSEVLEKYYGQEEITSQLDDFTDTVRGYAKDEVKNFKEAYEERAASDSLDYNPEKVIVRFESDISDDSIKEAMDVISDGGELVSEEEVDSDLPEYKKSRILKAKKSRKNDKVAVVDLSLAQSTDKAIESYEALDGVRSAEKDGIMEVASEEVGSGETVNAISNDPHVDQQWGLKKTYVSSAWSLLNKYKSHTCQVWVAVIDTGVDMDHEDLQGQLLKKYSVDITKSGYPLLTNTSPQYTSAHGTHVAGIVSAKAKNSIGVAGVAGITDSADDQIMSCKVMAIKATQEEKTFNTSDIISSIYYAIDKGAEIINLSLGSQSYNASFKTAIDDAYEAGVTVVASAGNDGKKITYYPADYNHVISVISINSNKVRSSTSNYGGKDISAPGDSILSTIPDNKYGYMSGTSMASPFVAGVVAMMKESDYALKPDDLEYTIKTTAMDIGATGYDPETAAGLVDAHGAVGRALTRYK